MMTAIKLLVLAALGCGTVWGAVWYGSVVRADMLSDHLDRTTADTLSIVPVVAILAIGTLSIVLLGYKMFMPKK